MEDPIMSETVKVIIVLLAVAAFVVGAFVLASKLFGPAKDTVRRERKPRPAKKEPAHAPASPAAPRASKAPSAAPLPDPRDFAHLTPPAAYSNQAARQAAPQPGRINYGSATQFVESAPQVNAAPAVPVPAMGGAPGAVGGAVMRVTISGDNGAPKYYVDIRENELPVTIGRGRSDARGKSIVVNEPTVSSQHAKLSVKNGIVSVCDCCSTCGTVINGENGSSLVLKSDSRNTSVDLCADRFEMTLGRMSVHVDILEPFCSTLRTGCSVTLSASFEGTAAGQWTFSDSFSIGRHGADLLLADPLVSRLHAMVFRSIDGRFILRDQGSTNGIVDARSGKQVSEIELQSGTVLMIGDTEVRVDETRKNLARDEMPLSRPRTVYFDSVSAAQNPRSV